MTAPIRLPVPSDMSDLEALEDMLHLPDGAYRGPGTGARNKEKTHCPKGHPYNEENTRVRMRKGIPQRSCKKCARERAALLDKKRMKCDPIYAKKRYATKSKSALKSREKQKQMLAELARLKAKYEP